MVKETHTTQPGFPEQEEGIPGKASTKPATSLFPVKKVARFSTGASNFPHKAGHLTGVSTRTDTAHLIDITPAVSKHMQERVKEYLGS